MNKLIFELQNTNGIKRTHKFTYQGSDHHSRPNSSAHSLVLTRSLRLLQFTLTDTRSYYLTQILLWLTQWWTKVVTAMSDRNQRYFHKVFNYLPTHSRTHSFTFSFTFIQAFEHLHLSPEILLSVSNETFQLRSFNQKEIVIGNKISKNSVQGTSRSLNQ